jgi:hypothetical protein
VPVGGSPGLVRELGGQRLLEGMEEGALPPRPAHRPAVLELAPALSGNTPAVLMPHPTERETFRSEGETLESEGETFRSAGSRLRSRGLKARGRGLKAQSDGSKARRWGSKPPGRLPGHPSPRRAPRGTRGYRPGTWVTDPSGNMGNTCANGHHRPGTCSSCLPTWSPVSGDIVHTDRRHRLRSIEMGDMSCSMGDASGHMGACPQGNSRRGGSGRHDGRHAVEGTPNRG